MRLRFVQSRIAIYAAAAFVAAVGTFWPTPYSLLLPGKAIALSDVVTVPDRPSPVVRFYLTDVSLVTGAAPFSLVDAFFPGVRLVRTEDVVPARLGDARFESLMRDEMKQSQDVAVYVAERAAGYHPPAPRSRVLVAGLTPASKADLRAGDVLVSVNGIGIAHAEQLHAALARMRPGAIAAIVYERDGVRASERVATIAAGGQTRLGIYIEDREMLPKPPVPIAFDLPDVSGSSGGLMFALQIYRTLRPSQANAGQRVAGTGTLRSDGTVGEIAGTEQKLVAARRAGATVFLVPVKNYPEIRDERGMRVVPVRTFDEAVRALASSGTNHG